MLLVRDRLGLRVWPVVLAGLFVLSLSCFLDPACASPVPSPSPAPAIPHVTGNQAACLQCHKPKGGFASLPATHRAYTEAECTRCHAVDPARAGVGDGIGACMGCHGNPEMTLPLPSGEELRLFVDRRRFVNSAHGNRLACADCHTSLEGGAVPHPTQHFANRRAYTTMLYEACKRCHFDNYTRTLDSVHFKALRSGQAGAPVCSDCHSAHYAHKPAVSRGRDSTACGKCHEEIYKKYAGSVHGQALLEDDNHDVPSCTTCHGVHNIGVANSNGFRLVSTQLCARCHADEKLMKKYGLPSNVLKTYLEDFHGRTVRFKQQQEGAVDPKEPLCIDCHGIHDIKSVKDPSSPVVKANLQKTCQKCHSDASTYFPRAWTGHYEPSMSRAPLVFLIRWTYIILIPVLVGGLLLHIGLDVWRLVKNR